MTWCARPDWSGASVTSAGIKMLYSIGLATAGSIVGDIIPVLMFVAVAALAATFID